MTNVTCTIDSTGKSSFVVSPIRYDIYDRHTGKIVGTAKTRKAASTSVDRRDNDYGAYRYQAQAVYAD